MKKKLQFLSGLIVAVITVMATTTEIWAQPPGMPGAPSQAPIDGGLSVLALAGGAYALKKIRENKKG
ncbi:hypothetical protein EP331_01565 [bacterium]|nr:MAG: hypothetical protein EP331_01565 [bacterium]